MTSHVLKDWTPEYDETTAMRARAQRKNHSTMVSQRDLIDYVQRRADAEALRWRSVCAIYSRGHGKSL